MMRINGISLMAISEPVLQKVLMKRFFQWKLFQWKPNGSSGIPLEALIKQEVPYWKPPETVSEALIQKICFRSSDNIHKRTHQSVSLELLHFRTIQPVHGVSQGSVRQHIQWLKMIVSNEAVFRTNSSIWALQTTSKSVWPCTLTDGQCQQYCRSTCIVRRWFSLVALSERNKGRMVKLKRRQKMKERWKSERHVSSDSKRTHEILR